MTRAKYISKQKIRSVNNRRLGGDDVNAKFKDVLNPDVQYRGNVVDRGDGSYIISYSIPLAGDYIVSISVDGEPVQYCVGPNGQRWNSRNYDGVRVYSSPSFCSLDDNLTLNVIHQSIHGLSSTLVDDQGLSGLTNALVGVENGSLSNRVISLAIYGRDQVLPILRRVATECLMHSSSNSSVLLVIQH